MLPNLGNYGNFHVVKHHVSRYFTPFLSHFPQFIPLHLCKLLLFCLLYNLFVFGCNLLSLRKLQRGGKEAAAMFPIIPGPVPLVFCLLDPASCRRLCSFDGWPDLQHDNRLQHCTMFHTLRNVDNITCCVSVWMRLYNIQTLAGSDLSLFGTGNETHPPPDFGGSWLCHCRKNFFSKIRVKKNNNQKKSVGRKCEKFVKINFGV